MQPTGDGNVLTISDSDIADGKILAYHQSISSSDS